MDVLFHEGAQPYSYIPLRQRFGAGTRALGSLLFGVSPIDLPTLGAAAILLAVVAVAASYLPARSAARTDPMLALRAE